MKTIVYKGKLRPLKCECNHSFIRDSLITVFDSPHTQNTSTPRRRYRGDNLGAGRCLVCNSSYWYTIGGWEGVGV